MTVVWSLKKMKKFFKTIFYLDHDQILSLNAKLEEEEFFL
jgi:hypothetical protein